MPKRELIIDSFAGGGGASLGIKLALGRCPDVAINHDEAAIAMHAANHPETLHYTEDVWKLSPRGVTKGKPVGLLWASPDCRHFSRAKGGKPVSKQVRSLAWVVVKWAAEVKPRVIILENVREFADWGPLVNGMPDKSRKGLTFKRWVGRLRNLGYHIEWRNLDAADFGVPTHRKRLFLVARRDGKPIEWPSPTHAKMGGVSLFGRVEPWRPAADCIDWSISCPSIFERKRPLADKTLRRIAMAVQRYVLENPTPFIVGVGGRAGQSPAVFIDDPIGTCTTKADKAVCIPRLLHLTHSGDRPSHGLGEPLPTIRVPGLGKPLGAVVSDGKHALAAACLARFNHGDKQWNSVAEPLGTVTSQGNKFGLVYAFLVKYFGTAIGSELSQPMHTVTAKHRFGLVTVEVASGRYENAIGLHIAGYGDFVLADIGLRMLTPRELARAQGFPEEYILTGSKSSQVARIGNSVCPVMAQKMVEANYSHAA